MAERTWLNVSRYVTRRENEFNGGHAALKSEDFCGGIIIAAAMREAIAADGEPEFVAAAAIPSNK